MLKRILTWGMIVGCTIGAAAEPTWTRQMKQLSEVLPELLLDVTSDERFNNPKNFSRIEKNTKKLSEMAHNISKTKMQNDMGTLEEDPSLRLIAGLFESDTERAYWALKEGHRPYGRMLVRSATSYCIGCHSRTGQGPSFPTLDLKVDTKTLTDLEKGDLLASLRQFDGSLDAYEKVLNDPNASKERMLDWERALRRALLLAVRVQKDPQRALKIVRAALAKPELPLYLKGEAIKWEGALVKWQKEPATKERTVNGTLMEARRLISEAKQSQAYPADSSGDIFYMRASSVVHEAMHKKMSPEQLSEAFLLEGISYEAMRDLGLVTLPEVYYESCIRNSPHTSIAQNCYERYEKNIHLGYTGSGGFDLPIRVKKDLEELKDLSKLRKTSSVANPETSEQERDSEGKEE